MDVTRGPRCYLQISLQKLRHYPFRILLDNRFRTLEIDSSAIVRTTITLLLDSPIAFLVKLWSFAHLFTCFNRSRHLGADPCRIRILVDQISKQRRNFDHGTAWKESDVLRVNFIIVYCANPCSALSYPGLGDR